MFLEPQSKLARPVLEDVPSDGEGAPTVVLKKLSQKHKDALSLLAQGLKRGEISSILGITPEYVTWLAKQPLCKAYLADLSEFVGVRLEALFEKSVDAISETLSVGTADEKLRAARLQMEATKRLGRVEAPNLNVQFVVNMPQKAESSSAWAQRYNGATERSEAVPALVPAAIVPGVISAEASQIESAGYIDKPREQDGDVSGDSEAPVQPE